jgi:dihydrofolate synthase/folylpolyglutamate synthase|tara:strand:+ start:2163 stop:3374 length:1212 start_codon:yes stop_codon:yes gene_type:complete
MTYQKTLDYLFAKLPMYQREGAIAYKEDIGNIITASRHLNNPHKKFKSIHIAGTNGKGSVAHMLASILQEVGYKTGLYTSPHLKDFRERIKINGQMIAEQKVIDFVLENKQLFEKLEMSFFEMTVALAFNYFAKEKVDVAVIETGLGGRLDSTNIINPELSIITNIGFDHTNLLGDTLEKITKEKAGIIKRNTPIIIGRKQEKTKQIFINIASDKKAKIYFTKTENNYSSDLKGIYQKENIATAIMTVKQLSKLGWNIGEKNIKNGLQKVMENTQLLGRWQILNDKPKVICDVGHNEDGIKQIVKQIKKIPYQNLHFVFGMVKDKNLSNILKLLPKKAKYYFCEAQIPRALEVSLLEREAIKFGLNGNSFSSVAKALAQAKKNANEDDLIFIGGSAFIVAEAL